MIRLPSVARLGAEAMDSFRRWPWVVGSAMCAGAYGMWVVGVEDPWELGLVKPMLVLMLGIPSFLAVGLFRQSRFPVPSRASRVSVSSYWFEIVSCFLLVLYFRAFVADDTRNAYTRFGQLHLAAMLAVAFAPFLSASSAGQENGFWQFNRQRFFRFVLSFVYSGVCFVGLTLALSSIQKLFGVHFQEAYGRLMIGCFFGLLPWHFVAGLDVAPSSLERDRTYPVPLRTFGQYLLVPLLVVYLVILYAYAGKIVISRTWPQGIVAWMVSGVSVYGVLVVLLLHPYAGLRDGRWIRAFTRSFWALILPLLVLHLTAVFQRIGQYGVTEHRYILVVLAVWLGGLGVSFLFRLSRMIRIVPISLCVVSLVTLAGPWSAYSVSLRSQRHRVDALLVRHRLVSGESLVRASRAVPVDDRRELTGILGYLQEWHGAGALPYRVHGVPVVLHSADGVMRVLGLEPVYGRGPQSIEGFSFTVSPAESGAVVVTGWDEYWELGYGLGSKRKIAGVVWTTEIAGSRALILRRARELVVSFPLHDLAGRMLARHRSGTVPGGVLLLDASAAGVRYRLVLHELYGAVGPSGPSSVSGRGYLLVKR